MVRCIYSMGTAVSLASCDLRAVLSCDTWQTGGDCAQEQSSRKSGHVLPPADQGKKSAPVFGDPYYSIVCIIRWYFQISSYDAYSVNCFFSSTIVLQFRTRRSSQKHQKMRGWGSLTSSMVTQLCSFSTVTQDCGCRTRQQRSRRRAWAKWRRRR